MSAADVASRALLVAGVAVILASCLAALSFTRVHDRLHYLTPITSLGAPLVGLSLAIENGWGETSAQILLTVFLLAVSGTVLEAATGRVAAEQGPAGAGSASPEGAAPTRGAEG